MNVGHWKSLNNMAVAGATVDNNESAGNLLHSGTSGNIDGPLRVGIFADAGSDRQEAGASYYGVMELSGNLWERVVTVGNSTGRSFAGSHGDGSLHTSGNADISDWPGWDGDDVTTATGAGRRGGGFSNSATNHQLSNLLKGAETNTLRGGPFGSRLVRTQ